jgi:hypothetical protein
MQMRRQRFVAIAAGAALLVGAGSTFQAAVAASSKPVNVPGPNAPGTSGSLTPQDQATRSRQDALMSFKTWILKVPGISGAGYVESINDAARKSTTLLWHGSSPLQQTVIRQGKARGIAVSVRPWAYSRAQIDAGVAAAWKQVSTDPAWRDFTVASIVGIDPEHSGIVVEGDWSPNAAVAKSAAEARMSAARSLGARASGQVGVQVDVVTGVASRAAFTRSTDVSPFYAAGYMISPTTGGLCSTGFSINWNGARRTTTARHCTANNYRARDGASTYGTGLGTSVNGQARVLSGTGGARNFDGAWNDPNGFSKHVAGLVDLSLGDFVCTSGGNSGVHCNVRVTAMVVSFNDGFGADSNIRGTQQTAGAISAIQGDSGGTVFTLNSSDEVLAAGMIQGIDGTLMTGSSCGSVHDAGSNLCSARVLFTSTRTIINSLGATLVT